MQKAQGRFIVFEGVDGSGKTTPKEMYAAHVRSRVPNARLVTTAEPFGTAGILIREILAGKHPALSDTEELARLFAAGRFDHAQRIIRPALEDGLTILCDR